MRIKKQEDIKDCGITIVEAFHEHLFGSTIPLNEIKREASYINEGITIAELSRLAKEFGMECESYRVDFEDVRKNAGEYFSTVVNRDGAMHYVIFRMNKRSVIVFDPLLGKHKISIKEFEEQYRGFLIVFTKKVKKRKKFKTDNYLLTSMGHPFFLSVSILTLILGIGLSYATSVFMKIILDSVIPSHLESTLMIVVLIFGWLGIMKIFSQSFGNYAIKKMTMIIENDIREKYYDKLINANVVDLNKLHKTDHLRRISAIPAVAEFIASWSHLLLHSILSLIIGTSLLIWINANLFGIALAFGLLLFTFSVLTNKVIKTQYLEGIEINMKVITDTMDFIESIEQLKDKRYKQNVNGIRKRNLTSQVKNDFSIWKLSSLVGGINALIYALGPIVITFIGSRQVFNNEISIGSLLLFLAFFNNFLEPLNSIGGFFSTYKQNKELVNLLKFTFGFKDEEVNTAGIVHKKINSIAVKDLSFGFGRSLLSIKNYRFDKDTILIGSNGSGKSTLLRILSARIPKTDSVLYNEGKLKYANLEEVRNKIFISTPSVFIPQMTIIEYITDNDQLAAEVFSKNLKKFNLIKILEKMNIDLSHTMTNNCSNFSSGQRQVILILKLFARNYDWAFLDEALENIDNKIYFWLKQSISRLDTKLIEISHSRRYIRKGKGVFIEKINEVK